jgi:hypothetical protein
MGPRNAISGGVGGIKQVGHSEDSVLGHNAWCCSDELRRENVSLLLVPSWSLRKSEKMEITCHKSSLHAASTYSMKTERRGEISFLLQKSLAAAARSVLLSYPHRLTRRVNRVLLELLILS